MRCVDQVILQRIFCFVIFALENMFECCFFSTPVLSYFFFSYKTISFVLTDLKVTLVALTKTDLLLHIYARDNVRIDLTC
jgi:hypothetical protein